MKNKANNFSELRFDPWTNLIASINRTKLQIEQMNQQAKAQMNKH